MQSALLYCESAVAHAGSCPGGAKVKSLRLRGLDRPGYSGLAFKGTAGGAALGGEQLRVIITDDGAGGATVFDVQLPDRLPTTVKCDPRDGWTSGSNLRRYRNYSNALPPDCIAGSAQGLQRYEAHWTGTSNIKIKAKKGSMAQVIGPLRIGFYRGTGPVNECDGNVGTAACIVKPGEAKCSSAP